MGAGGGGGGGGGLGGTQRRESRESYSLSEIGSNGREEYEKRRTTMVGIVESRRFSFPKARKKKGPGEKRREKGVMKPGAHEVDSLPVCGKEPKKKVEGPRRKKEGRY